jgi:hypothetical protein
VSAPPIVWIDERVAKGLPQQKDPELAERGVVQERYIIQKRVNDLVAAARGPTEFIVQISVRINERADQRLVALTNYGRLFAEVTGGWKELELPKLEP